MSKPTDGGAFNHEIRVGWADCDPARIAFTGRIPYWALEAIDAWWGHYTDTDWFALNVDRGFGTPFVHMDLDFRAPVTPRHKLRCTVRLLALGNSSITHRVEGWQDGVLCFEGNFVSVFVQSLTLASRRPPEALRKVLAALCPPPENITG